MRIAIDGRTIVPTRSGVGIYTEQIVRSLLRLDDRHEYLLFHVADVSWLEAPNLTRIRIEGYDRMIANRWWENILLPGHLARHGIDVYFSPGFVLPTLPRLRPLAAHLPLPRHVGALFNSRRAVRYVVTIHDVIAAIHPEAFTPKMRMWQAIFNRNAAAVADAIIAVSESSKRDFERLYRPRTRQISAVPNSVDERFARVTDIATLDRVTRRYSLPDSFVLYVGTVEPRKNLVGLARAYARLPEAMRRRHPLVICGALGWHVDSILGDIDALQLSDTVKFIGFADHEDLPALYSLATIFAYPSLYEGFGYPPLEAMACGVPVITSNTSSLPEVVGDAAILVDPRDHVALADHLEHLLGDPALQATLGARGRDRAGQFRWDVTARRTLSVLESVVPDGSAPATPAIAAAPDS